MASARSTASTLSLLMSPGSLVLAHSIIPGAIVPKSGLTRFILERSCAVQNVVVNRIVFCQTERQDRTSRERSDGRTSRRYADPRSDQRAGRPVLLLPAGAARRRGD